MLAHHSTHGTYLINHRSLACLNPMVCWFSTQLASKIQPKPERQNHVFSSIASRFCFFLPLDRARHCSHSCRGQVFEFTSTHRTVCQALLYCSACQSSTYKNNRNMQVDPTDRIFQNIPTTNKVRSLSIKFMY